MVVKNVELTPPSPPVPLSHTTQEFYDVFQNRVGGGKPKMRAYFSDNGWPTTTAHTDPTTVPSTPEERETIIDILQEWKSARYQALILAGAGMRCVVTYTRSTKTQTFPGAERVVACLTHDDGRPAVTVRELMKGGVVQDDRVEFKA